MFPENHATTPDRLSRMALTDLPREELRCPPDLHVPQQAAQPPAPLPLVVSEPTDGVHTIIDGCLRFAACDRDSLQCLVVSSMPWGDAAARLRLQLNRNRPKSPHEQALFYRWFHAHADATCLTSQELQSVGLDRNASLLADLPDTVLTAMDAGMAHKENASHWAALQPDDGCDVLAFFQHLSLSRQMERELLEWLPEIADRSGVSVQSILSSKPVASAIDVSGGNRPQAAQRLRHSLEQMRFPTLTAVRERWQQVERAVNTQRTHLRLSPSDSFEHDLLEVRFTVGTPDDAAACVQTLAAIDRRQWQTLISPVTTMSAE